MAGYATGTSNGPNEEEEEKNVEGNRKQPATNPIGGSHGWEKGSVARARSERAGNLVGYVMGLGKKSLKSMKKKKTQQGTTNSWKGTLSGEIMAGETKMLQRLPHTRWGFTEEQQEDLQNRRLRC